MIEVVGLIDEDMVNYKKCSMYIAFPKCSFKCGKENCQNYKLSFTQPLVVEPERICERYLNNPLTNAIVIGGLEPLDSFFDLLSLIDCFRYKYKCEDDIVIYTGYTEEEVFSSETKLAAQCKNLLQYKNLIFKFGRYVPNEEAHFDEILGVKLASNNQYGKRVT